LTDGPAAVKMKLMRYAAVLILLIFSGCDQKTPEPSLPVRGEQEIYRVEITQSRFNRKIWKLRAMSIRENGDTIVFYRFKVSFFGPDEKLSSVLRADSGRLYKKTEDMEAYGNVKIFFLRDSTQVYTSHIIYESRKRLIKGDREVKILTPDGEILGKGFVTDPEMKHIKIYGKVRGHGG